MSKLTFDTLRRANMARLPLFKNCHGEIAHEEADGSDWSRSDWLEAVVGELGEYANISKKYRRGDITSERFYAEARNELADALIYLDLLAAQLGINLDNAIVNKFNLVSDRIGCPVKILNNGNVVGI